MRVNTQIQPGFKHDSQKRITNTYIQFYHDIYTYYVQVICRYIVTGYNIHNVVHNVITLNIIYIVVYTRCNNKGPLKYKILNSLNNACFYRVYSNINDTSSKSYGNKMVRLRLVPSYLYLFHNSPYITFKLYSSYLYNIYIYMYLLCTYRHDIVVSRER